MNIYKYARWGADGFVQVSIDGETWLSDGPSKPRKPMYLHEAIESQLPLKLPGWPGWYRWNANTGTFKPVDTFCGLQDISILPTHHAASDKWIVEENPNREWHRPKLLWHREKEYYKESRNWYPTQEAAIEAYAKEFDVVEWEQRTMLRRFVKS